MRGSRRRHGIRTLTPGLKNIKKTIKPFFLVSRMGDIHLSRIMVVNTQQTCLYGSHMGYPYGTHMGSATGFGMGPIWVSPYAGCPDGFHMGPI